jgi:hypothetical protein
MMVDFIESTIWSVCLNRTIIGLKAHRHIRMEGSKGRFKPNYYRIEKQYAIAWWTSTMSEAGISD